MEGKKTHWRHLTDEPYMGAWDLETDGKFIDVIVTIEGLRQGDFVAEMGKQKKTFIKFREFSKEMMCNKTNLKRLQDLFGTFDYRKFAGKKAILTVEKVKDPKRKGSFVDALRFKTTAPIAENKDELTKEHKQYENVCIALKSGAYSLKQVTDKYSVNNELETELKKLIPASNE